MRPKKNCGLRVEPLETRALMSADVVLDWNELLLQSITINTAPVPMARNMAIVSVAMFDAVNAIERSFEPYYADVHASRGASKEAAAAKAAYDTLVALYPSRVAQFDAQLAESLAGIDPDRAAQGIAVGREVARQILALRANDRSSPAMPWTPPNNDPGTYQLTPVAPPGTGLQPAGNLHVSFITPFAIPSNSQFRPGPHPALDSPEYAADLNEVKVVGASDADQPGVDRDGNGLPDRTADQTLVAELWRAALGNHTVWNRIAQNQAATHDLSVTEAARVFALLNMSLNDGLQTSYESKYHYELWRPLTAVQRADEDGNDATVGEPTWMTEHPNTPPYPAYASNASTIGGACATVLTDIFGGNVPFTVNWAQGPRSYTNFWAAADEQAEARIFGGIHFRFDCEAGQEIGRDVGGYILDNFLTPRDHPSAFLTAAAAPNREVHRSLRDHQVQPLLTEALRRWDAAGIDTSGLSGLDVRIADLGGLTLAQADNGVIWVDDNAAGWGWFADRTPRTDTEFTRRGNQGEKNRMDLLTVLTHEVGHLIGQSHTVDGVMQETLAAGTRRTADPVPGPAWLRGASDLISWGGDMPGMDLGVLGGSTKRK